MTISHLPALSIFAVLTAFACSFATAGEEVCGEYGTSVIFADSPADAAKQALKDEKLLFILHVSGLFDDSDFT